MNKTQSLVYLAAALLVTSASAGEKWDISKLDMSKLPPVSTQTNVTFAKDIQPIFESSCLHCHGEERQRGKLRLDTLQGVIKGGKDGKVILAGDSKSSLLVAAIAQLNDEVAMPPKGHPGGHHPPPPSDGGPDNRDFHKDGPPPDGGPGPGGPPPGEGGPGENHPQGRGPQQKALTPAQIGLIRAWIDQGAN